MAIERFCFIFSPYPYQWSILNLQLCLQFEISELDGVSKDACAASVKSNIEGIYAAIIEQLNKLKE